MKKTFLSVFLLACTCFSSLYGEYPTFELLVEKAKNLENNIRSAEGLLALDFVFSDATQFKVVTHWENEKAADHFLFSSTHEKLIDIFRENKHERVDPQSVLRSPFLGGLPNPEIKVTYIFEASHTKQDIILVCETNVLLLTRYRYSHFWSSYIVGSGIGFFANLIAGHPDNSLFTTVFITGTGLIAAFYGTCYEINFLDAFLDNEND